MKNPPFRSEKWLAAVRALDECVVCGARGVQAAHRNADKGMGIKASDCLTAALCPHCHAMLDQGKEMSRMERRAEMDRAIVLTVERLAKAGRLVCRPD
jgi:hypothetical protein